MPGICRSLPMHVSTMIFRSPAVIAERVDRQHEVAVVVDEVRAQPRRVRRDHLVGRARQQPGGRDVGDALDHPRDGDVADLSTAGSARPLRLPRSVDGAALLEHGDELLDAAGPRLRTLGVVDAEQDRVAVRAVKLLERAGAPWRCGAAHASGRRAPRWCAIPRRPRPTARRPCAASTCACPAGSHPARRDQRLDLVAVDLRPLAARLPRGEALPEVHVVVPVAQAVDPAPAERGLDHVGHVDGGDAGALLGDLQPDAGRRVVVLAPATRSHAFADANSSTGRSGTCSATAGR